MRGPPARMSSSFTPSFNLKAALRGGHADRRSSPAHAPCSDFFQGDRFLEAGTPGCAGLRPACLPVSPLHLISKQLCTGDMRIGGPRQPTHPARASTRLPVGSVISYLSSIFTMHNAIALPKSLTHNGQNLVRTVRHRKFWVIYCRTDPEERDRDR